MTLHSYVKELRDELLRNCEYAIERLEAAKDKVAYYSSKNQDGAMTGSSYQNMPTDDTSTDPSGTKKSESDISYEISDHVIMSSFMCLTHGTLIQEWEHFLYDIFVEGTIYYLRGYNLSDSTYKLSLKNLKPSIKLSEMRENLSEEFRISLKGHKELFSQTCKLFGIEEPELLNEIQKQAQIRHIFQHNRGFIRNRDLKNIGREGSSFDILNEEGAVILYEEGQKILLSLPEIQKLYDTIEKYSLKFQEIAKNAEPVKAL